jgi:hypothetical protein
MVMGLVGNSWPNAGWGSKDDKQSKALPREMIKAVKYFLRNPIMTTSFMKI